MQATQTPRITYVTLSQIKMLWPGAQRQINEDHKNRIRDNFDPDLFAAVTLAKPNGKEIYHPVDGHHRIEAAKEALGMDQQIPAIIIPIDDDSAAAESFLRINGNRRGIHSVDKFQVAVTAGRPIETCIDGILSAYGFAVGYGTKHVGCPDAFCSLYKRGCDISPEWLIDRTLSAITLAYKGSGVRPIARANVLSVGSFIRDYLEYDHETLVKALKSSYADSGKLEQSVKDFQQTISAKNISEAGSGLLLIAYNKKASAKNKLHPR